MNIGIVMELINVSKRKIIWPFRVHVKPDLTTYPITSTIVNINIFGNKDFVLKLYKRGIIYRNQREYDSK